PVARARVLNLVVLVEAERLNAAADDAADLAVHHPARTIIVGMDRTRRENSMTAEVRARCHVFFGRRQQVCSEQVIVTATGESVEEFHGVVTPLLTSDLPTFLWWMGRRWPEGHAFERLMTSCNRVIIDSGSFIDSVAEFDRLQLFIRDYSQSGAVERSVADINWTRLTPWRLALAGLYDVPTYRQCLATPKRVSITYLDGLDASKGNTQTDKHLSISGPVLIAGWLASRLGWTSKARIGTGVVKFLSGESELEVALQPVQYGKDAPGCKACYIQKVEFECGQKGEAKFSIQMGSDFIETRAAIQGLPEASRKVGFNPSSEADLVAEELDFLARDFVYEESVHSAVGICRFLA
ncbi:MAG TPA: glucose-6-phosphate dehydrogenase assembly protein OpcA, partial [Blastocatellia bacterium]|nr:glucose-6-phosphate dehydrogenase assembly protein OpcA [Blastocatellia bacterium]